MEDEEEEEDNQYEVDTRQSKRIKTDNYVEEEVEEEVEFEVEEGPAKDEGWLDLDAEDIDDPLMVAEYVNDIFEYMKALEVSTRWSFGGQGREGGFDGGRSANQLTKREQRGSTLGS